VSVGISDIDSGTGTRYYSCRVEAELRPSGGSLIEEVSDSDLFRAIDRAMDQVGRGLWEGVRSSPHRDRSLTRLGRVAAAAGQGG
jgi:hypothetical protein